MANDSKVMRLGLVIAAAIIVLRIILEQAGVRDSINNIFGVAWLYLILPVLFAFAIRAQGSASPYGKLLKNVLLFAVYTRLMVMVTYMLAYAFRWSAPRFGIVRGDTGPWAGILFIPARNLLYWVFMATLAGMIIGSLTLLLKRKKTAPAAA